jgi:hypothetical protein
MSQNVYDQASRYFAKLEPAVLLPWLMGVAPADLIFRGWIDTRLIPFPGEADRYCDTVAHLENVQEGQVPWAVILEFQIVPDALMFGRSLGYGIQIWLELKPSEERGDRFQFGVVLVNLTGRGNTSREMRWGAAGMELVFRAREINLCEQEAQGMLDGIAAATVPGVVLALIPLMRGGDNPVIIQQWLSLASAESDARRRGDLGALAVIFAEAVGYADVWKQALKGWNVVQSPQVLEWQAEARAEGKAEGKVEAILRLLQLRFGALPPDLVAAIRATTDLTTLNQWFDLAVSCPTLADYRQTASV